MKTANRKRGAITETIREQARDIPVVHTCDVCVIGGSNTGVFAAVAAARLGATVAIVEALGYFGGTATASLINVWHTHLDAAFKKPIVGGLTVEMIDRLKRRQAVVDHGPSDHHQYMFLPAELTTELDEMVAESAIRAFLHARFVAPVVEDGRVIAAIIEDKSGRRAIRAKVFVDASGDADLVHRAGLSTYRHAVLQPPTTGAIFQGLGSVLRKNPGIHLSNIVFNPKHPKALRPGFLWSSQLPGGGDLYMISGTRVPDVDCSDADQLTYAEMEGRQQVRRILDLIRENFKGGETVALAALPALTGIRDTRHARCLHRLTEQEVLTGTRFPDAIANGSYRVDLHHPKRAGLIYRYLDGREETVSADGRREVRRWRRPVKHEPTFYQIPYRSLVPQGTTNVLVAGRCLDADDGAFGAARVMVNTGQMGQAAGAAAWLALDSDRGVADIDAGKLRTLLARQGMIML
jgi:hypothetical protein